MNEPLTEKVKAYLGNVGSKLYLRLGDLSNYLSSPARDEASGPEDLEYQTVVNKLTGKLEVCLDRMNTTVNLQWGYVFKLFSDEAKRLLRILDTIEYPSCNPEAFQKYEERRLQLVGQAITSDLIPRHAI